MQRQGDHLEHVPVLLQEALSALAIRPEGCYVDATFGRGGHSQAILARLSTGALYALDRDPEAMSQAHALQQQYPRLKPVSANFAGLETVLTQCGVEPGSVDGILFDLGTSSPQLDTPERGFSFRHDGPLDMRMDPTQGESVAEWLARADEAEIARVIWEYGEEKFSKGIARTLVRARAEAPLQSTRQVAQIIARAVPRYERGQDPATRTFQAWRIFINQELEAIKQGLMAALSLLKTGGRLVVIAFHSLEDRLVKQFMQIQAKPELAYPELRKLPLAAIHLPLPSLRIIGKAVRASAEEITKNPRARSAILRVSERLSGPLIPMQSASKGAGFAQEAWA